MQLNLTLKGLSSGKEFEIPVSDEDKSKSMLNFLREKGHPIAFSCRGERICHRCIINDEILSCSLTVESFIKEHGLIVKVDYL